MASPEQPDETPDREYMRHVREARANTKHIGIELMHRWNWFEMKNPLFQEYAVMGHEYEEDFTFLIEVNGKIFHVSVTEEE
jgi:hypothetical protein